MLDRYGIIAAQDIAVMVKRGNPHVLDVRPIEAYQSGHVPGAVAVDYTTLVERRNPILGLLPPEDHLRTVMSRSGLNPDDDVIAYDDEGGGRACRLLWTLDVLGHRGKLLLLDGGYAAWRNTGTAPERSASNPAMTTYVSTIQPERNTTSDYICAHLNDARCRLLDARSAGEYQGLVVRAQRGGHIPGAVHVEWTETMTADRRLKPRSTLIELYATKGVTPDREIIVYCHSHHRSAHSYFVLKWLGFPHVRGYAGSWSEWGNRNDLPIA